MRSCGSSLNRDTVKEEVDEGSSNISKIIVCFTIPTQSLPPTPFPPPWSLRFERGRQAGGRRYELLPAAAALLSLVGAARPQIVQQDLLGVAILQEEDDGRRLGEQPGWQFNNLCTANVYKIKWIRRSSNCEW